jgi:hypothetical protein
MTCPPWRIYRVLTKTSVTSGVSASNGIQQSNSTIGKYNMKNRSASNFWIYSIEGVA